jgi:hypothetical protein
MLRTLAISLLLSLGGTAIADKPAPAKPTAPPAAAALPLPKDASAPSDAPGGGGAIQMYQVPRGRDVVIAEMRDLFKAGGWAITKDDPSPSGRAVRLEVTKDKKVYKVSFTGDTTRTAIIVTLP